MSRVPNPARSGRIVSQYANDPEMAELVELFITELPTRVKALQSAWQAGEVNDLTRMTHQLKGSSAGYGFSSIGDAAGALEQRLLSLRDCDSESAIEGLSAEFRKLVELCARASAGR